MADIIRELLLAGLPKVNLSLRHLFSFHFPPLTTQKKFRHPQNDQAVLQNSFVESAKLAE